MYDKTDSTATKVQWHPGTAYQPFFWLSSAQQHRKVRLPWKKDHQFCRLSHQKFLTWLSVLPGRRLAISDQRLPISALVFVIKASSSGVHVPFLMLGSATTISKKYKQIGAALSVGLRDVLFLFSVLGGDLFLGRAQSVCGGCGVERPRLRLLQDTWQLIEISLYWRATTRLAVTMALRKRPGLIQPFPRTTLGETVKGIFLPGSPS